MLYPFFALAMQSPGRQLALRRAAVLHAAAVGGVVGALLYAPRGAAVMLLGCALLIAGIVEGATLLGWRLTQLPKSQAFEFLLVTPLHPWRVFLAEFLVGAVRLALVTLTGLPILALLVVYGLLDPLDLGPMLVMPLTWGLVTGLAVTAWAYETEATRRATERVLLLLVLVYLVVGVLAGEHLKKWLDWLPGGVGAVVVQGVDAFHTYNPFAVLRSWALEDLQKTWPRVVGVEAGAVALGLAALARGMGRVRGHFQDRHYRPATRRHGEGRAYVGDRPLVWWAVRRVTQFSGRVNLWLAGGFALLYALHTLAGDAWPSWMGRRVFTVFDQAGGIPVWATCLVVLGAVPAAFQYGLWDSNAQDRCRRLELLLLTRVTGRDFWDAALAAAWRRGRGYFGVALGLWLAAGLAGKVAWAQILAALAAGVVLWGLYFAIGFRAFTRGAQANALGTLLTLGLPVTAVVFTKTGHEGLANLLPPGSVYAAGAGSPNLSWAAGPLLAGALMLTLTRHALTHCDHDLRAWYEAHHGRKLAGD